MIMHRGRTLVVAMCALSLAAAVPAQVTPAPAAQPPPGAAAPSPTAKTFTQQDLDQLLAPIALYPDALLAQVLMASTYPLEVVAAERWVKANATLKDKALEDALQKQTWDPSVKSLAVFPQVLTMMSEKVDWTQKLGDAFLAQQKDVMETVQALRQKASAQGNLKDTEQQKVTTEKVENTTVIKIEPAKPEVVYVPTYNPTVVYGSWWWPSYPPYSYYPPGYVAGGALLGFTAGVIVGGALWGGVNWGRGDVNIDVNRYNNFNRTNVSNSNWQHNASHRGAVPYKDKAVAQQHGRGQSADAGSREAFRGRAESGQQAIQRGDVSRDSVSRTGGAGGPSGRDLGISAQGSAQRNYNAGNRSGGGSASAFDSSRGAQASSHSARGSSSLSSARSSGNMSAGGGGRGGGGGGRGGGGGGRR
jgi:Protein of unknown function (DUF3300)